MQNQHHSHCGRFQPIANRRHFLQRAGGGLGMLALADLLSQSGLLAAETAAPGLLAPRKGHFPAKAQSVIWLFMEGAPSIFSIPSPNWTSATGSGSRSTCSTATPAR